MISRHFLYRLSQKWKYHTGNSFEKKVADINRNEPLISLKGTTFKVKGSELLLTVEDHSFVINRFEQFQILLAGRGEFRIEGRILIYKIDNVSLRVTTAEEIFIIHEIFFETCYSVLVPWTYNVIDIGMNVGFASLFFANNSKVLKVHGYEPFAPTFNNAISNFVLNPSLNSKIAANNFGLSSNSEWRKLPYSSDLKGKNSIHNTGGESENIELKNTNDVLDKLFENSEERFFVKMDCEGAEFEIFESLQKRMIPEQIFGFIIEWHFRDPQPIIDVLLLNHFKVQIRGDQGIGLITAFR